tara:strand:+ start:383 stop:541 length:159 start_codon:yes stop_codon:yes gene_type:complete
LKEKKEATRDLSHEEKEKRLDELFEALDIQKIVLQLREESQRTYINKKYEHY